MALSGLDIFKQLPKTNCGDCGIPTCLAFAMKLAQGQAELTSCPHVSEEAKAALSEASAPAMRAVTVGTGETAFTVGEETVLFRHEKTFVNPSAIGVVVSADEPDDAIAEKVADANAATYERVQQTLRCGFVAVRSAGDSARWQAVVDTVAAGTGLPLILMTEDADAMSAALAKHAARKPLIHAASDANADAMIALAKEHGCPLAVRAHGLAAVTELTAKAAAAGVTQLVIDPAPESAAEALRDNVFARRSALVKKVAELGYPVMSIPGDYSGGDPELEVVYAAVNMLKYANVVALSGAKPWEMLPLLVLRQNIFTDPQRPMQAEAKIYEIGNPGPDAPFFVTTNFSLTYFIVAGEIEAAKTGAYLGIVESEGLSVLTAWAAGKFVPERIAKFVNESGMGDKLAHHEVIIPGAVAQISGELKEELDGWDVTVGPYEAADIPVFLKRRAS